jgi:hypothetical protein
MPAYRFFAAFLAAFFFFAILQSLPSPWCGLRAFNRLPALSAAWHVGPGPAPRLAGFTTSPEAIIAKRNSWQKKWGAPDEHPL